MVCEKPEEHVALQEWLSISEEGVPGCGLALRGLDSNKETETGHDTRPASAKCPSIKGGTRRLPGAARRPLLPRDQSRTSLEDRLRCRQEGAVALRWP